MLCFYRLPFVIAYLRPAKESRRISVAINASQPRFIRIYVSSPFLITPSSHFRREPLPLSNGLHFPVNSSSPSEEVFSASGAQSGAALTPLSRESIHPTDFHRLTIPACACHSFYRRRRKATASKKANKPPLCYELIGARPAPVAFSTCRPFVEVRRNSPQSDYAI